MCKTYYQSVASRTAPARDLTCNPVMCPDWESNWQRFSLQASTQSSEPHQLGWVLAILNIAFDVFLRS